MIMFKVGAKDYSNRVLAQKYSVNKTKQWESWKDASGTEHRSLVRTQVKGTFEMYFKSVDELTDFVQDLEDNSEEDMSVACVVCDNRTNTEQSIYAFIDFDTNRRKNGVNEDVFETIKVTITER